MKTRVSLKHFLNDCLWKQFFAFNLPQTPSNLILLTILVTLSSFTKFELKIRVIKLQKVQQFALIGNCFSDPFIDV